MMDCQNRGPDGQAAIRVPRVGPVSHVPRIGPATPRPGACGLPVMSVNGRLPDRTGRVTLMFSDLSGADYATVAELIEAATGRRLVNVDGEVDWTGASVNPVRNGAVAIAIAARYEKPAGGIPMSDLAPSVSALLDGALQMSSSGLASLLDGKADKSAMSVVPGTGADADKVTIQLKSGTTATVLVSHQSLASCVTGGSYDSTNKKILLKHGGTTLAEINATDFIKDGMVSGVAIVNVPSDETPTGLPNGDYLKVTFNTDAGTDPIYIPLADIFNPSNYYAKAAADAEFVKKVPGKGLSTNDYDATEKGKVASALQPADVDSTLSQTGKAADAKATGDALAMKRGVTDLGVRGAPTPDNGGVFVVNGVAVQYSANFGGWNAPNVLIYNNSSDGSYHLSGPFDSVDFTISASNGYRAVIQSASEEIGSYEIVGILDSLATGSQTELTPVYSEWVCDPAHIPVEDLMPDMESFAPNGVTPYVAYANAEGVEITLGGEQTPVWMAVRPAPFTVEWQNEDERVAYNPAATSITTYSQIVGRSFSATRTIIGYTLGAQTTKPLQPQGNYATTAQLAAKQDTIADLAAIRSGAAAGATAYQKPQAGIPSSDMASGVQTSLGKADTAVQPAALRYDLPADATAISSASSEVVEGETVTYGAATLADRTANRVEITAALDELRLTFPAAVSGKVRDFGLRVEVGDGTAALTAPALVPVAPTGEAVTLENANGAIPALADGTADAKGVTLLYFSETSPGVFLVKGEEVKEA